jgi:hypothetical protein
MKLNLPKATASGHRHVAQILWRNAHHLPKDQRLKALKQAALHAGLARALDAYPNLGLDKCPPGSLSETANKRD